MTEIRELSVAVFEGDHQFRENLVALLQAYLSREILVASTTEESLAMVYGLDPREEIHGAFIGEFDRAHIGLRAVVGAVEYSQPKAMKIAMVYGDPRSVKDTGADIKIADINVGSNIEPLLVEIARHIDEQR